MRLVRVIISMVALVLIGGFLTVISIRDKIEFANRRDISDMEGKDFHAGQFVTGDIVLLWDNFAYTEETNTKTHSKKTSERYYAMPLESTLGDDEPPMFIALVVEKSADVLTARRLLEETDNLYEHGEIPETIMTIDGKITRMDDKVYEALSEYLEDNQDIDKSHIVRYELHVGGNANSSTPLMIIGLVLLVVGLGVLAVIVITFLRNRVR